MKIVRFISKNWILFIIASLLAVGFVQLVNIIQIHPDMSNKRNFNLYMILPWVLVVFGYLGGLLVYLFLRLAIKVQLLSIYRNLYAYGLLFLTLVFVTLISIQIYRWFTTKEVVFQIFSLPGFIIVPAKAYSNLFVAKD